MFRVCFLSLVLVSLAVAQKPVEYKATFDNAVHHEAEISVSFSGIKTPTLEVLMSRSSAGRYALHEFGKNVYNVRAVDGKGKPLTITRPNPYQWNIKGHNGSVTVSYTLYGDHADGTYAGIDSTHAHLNMPAAFMWAHGFEKRPITITFKPFTPSWKVATQLAATKEAYTFTAPHLQYFFDSPTELSEFTMREWTVVSNGKPYTLRLVVHHLGSEKIVDAYAELAKVIVQEECAVYGEPALYDYGTYTFLADYLPWIHGDGMEHRNSTVIASTRALSPDPMGHLGTLAHEFFHSWNVKRIRPKSLEPFDFERANMSGELWFAEGFTSYYGDLLIHRAQLTSLDRFARSFSGDVNAVVNNEGRLFFSPIEMSEQAPFVDAATSVDPTNRVNTFISYYSWGSALGLGLDLTLRTRFPGLTLDDLMKAMWQKFGKTAKPYTNDDICHTLGDITHDHSFADDFFRRYMYGREVVDYEKLLSSAGLLLRKARADKASVGNNRMNYDNGVATVSLPTIIGSPLYKAGLDVGDKIFRIGSMSIKSAKDLDSLLALSKPGESVPIEYEQRGMKKTAGLIFEENRQLEIVTNEKAELPVTDAMLKFREDWLGSKAHVAALTKTCPLCKKTYPFKTEKCPDDNETLRVVIE